MSWTWKSSSASSSWDDDHWCRGTKRQYGESEHFYTDGWQKHDSSESTGWKSGETWHYGGGWRKSYEEEKTWCRDENWEEKEEEPPAPPKVIYVGSKRQRPPKWVRDQQKQELNDLLDALPPPPPFKPPQPDTPPPGYARVKPGECGAEEKKSKEKEVSTPAEVVSVEDDEDEAQDAVRNDQYQCLIKGLEWICDETACIQSEDVVGTLKQYNKVTLECLCAQWSALRDNLGQKLNMVCTLIERLNEAKGMDITNQPEDRKMTRKRTKTEDPGHSVASGSAALCFKSEVL